MITGSGRGGWSGGFPSILKLGFKVERHPKGEAPLVAVDWEGEKQTFGTFRGGDGGYLFLTDTHAHLWEIRPPPPSDARPFRKRDFFLLIR